MTFYKPLSTQEIQEAELAGQEDAAKYSKPVHYRIAIISAHRLLNNFPMRVYPHRVLDEGEIRLRAMLIRAFKTVSMIDVLEDQGVLKQCKDMDIDVVNGLRIELLEAASVYMSRGESDMRHIPEIEEMLLPGTREKIQMFYGSKYNVA